MLSRRTSIASKSSGWSPARSLPPGFIWRDFNWVFRDLIGSAQYHMNHYQSWITLNKPCGNGFLQNLNNLELAMHWCWSQTKFGFGTCDQEKYQVSKTFDIQGILLVLKLFSLSLFHADLLFLELQLCLSAKKWPLGEAELGAENGYGSNTWKSWHPQPKCKFGNPN